MTDITKLPDKLRVIAQEICDVGHYGWPNGLNDIADEIEAALPKPTIIIEDESTHPEIGNLYVFCYKNYHTGEWSNPVIRLWDNFDQEDIHLDLECVYWLIGDLFQPPEDES